MAATPSSLDEGMMELKFCSLCGTERWPGAAFCGGCGAAFVTEPAVGIEPAWALPEQAVSPTLQPAAALAEPQGAWTDEATAPFESGVPSGQADGAAVPWDSVDVVANEPLSVVAAPAPATAPPAPLVAFQLAAARVSPLSIGFAALGLLLVGAGCVLVGAGIPEPGVAHAPLTTGDLLGSRLADAAAMVAALASAGAALLIATLATRRAIGPGPATGLLLVFGATGTGLAILTATSAGWTASGDVLPGPILMITGGAAALSAAVSGWIARE